MLSSAEPTARARTRGTDTARAVADVAALVEFRRAGVRGRARGLVAAGTALLLSATVLAAWAPAHLPGAAGSPGAELLTADDVLLLLPTTYLGVLVVAVLSAASSGGGRELLPRDVAVAFPVSPTTDHLGALLMAPLNIAWLLQAWVVLGATAFVVGPGGLLVAQVPVLLWLGVATAWAQVVAWVVEWVRRGPWGPWIVRGLVVCSGGGLAALVVTDHLVPLLDRSPTEQVVLGALHGAEGSWWPWWGALLVLTPLGLAAVAVGAWLAHVLARRPPRDEARMESAVHPARAHPRSDLGALVRLDRAGVWRSVPLRRGLMVLAVLPGLVAAAAALDWHLLSLLPGLIASGGALIFGVNAWCLDGRGALWRESLPVPSRTSFTARLLVQVEVLVLLVVLGLVLASLRAGLPDDTQAVAVGCSAVVVVLQAASASMRWSLRHPFAVDLRSPRATPAPPLTMVAYSGRLAVVTSCSAMLFVTTSRADDWRWSVLVAAPLALVSAYRLGLSARRWDDATERSRVVTAVAG